MNKKHIRLLVIANAAIWLTAAVLFYLVYIWK
jgi:hypothetical protein